MNEVLEVVIKSRPDQFVAGMSTATTSAEKFSGAMDQLGRTASAVGGVVDAAFNKVQRAGKMLIGTGSGVAASIAGMTYQSIQFDSAMRNVFTVANKADGSFGKMSDSVLKMSRTLPQSSGNLAAGLYDIESSGFKGADALNVLEQSAISASAGLSSTATAAATIDAILNAYGKSADEAADISDILFQTVNVGVLSFEELASTTGEWVSMAAASGVAADDAAAALAAMTLSGMSAAEASTSLTRVMQEFIDPGKEMQKLLGQMGYESGTAMIAQEGLYGSMEKVRQATGGASSELVNIFEDIRGARGAMALMANEGGNYADTFAAITDETGRSGAALAAFNVQAGGQAAKLVMLKNNLMALSIALGGPFLKAMNLVTTPLIMVLDAFNDMPGPVKSAVGVFAVASSAVMILGGALLAFKIKSLVWSATWRSMGGVMAKFAGGTEIGAVQTAFTKLSTLFTRFGKTGGPIGMMQAQFKVFGTSMKTTSDIASVFAPRMMQVFSILAKGGIVVGAAALAFYLMQRNIKKAGEEGDKAGKAFVKGLGRGNMQEINDSMDEIRERIDEVNGSLLQGPKGVGRLSSLSNWQKAFSELLTGSNTRAAAEAKALKEGLRDLEEEATRSQLRMDKAMGITADPRPGTDAANKLNRMRSSFEKFAESRGVKTTIDVDFNKDPDEYNRQAAEMERSTAELWDEFNNGKPAMQNVQAAMFDMGKAFEDSKSKVEALDKVLNAFYDEDFGLEAANDQVEGGLNEMYKSIQDFKERGTLDEALRPGSFHEDAISLRGDMRGIVADMNKASIEWAKTQDNLTGDQFLNHVNEQADALHEAGIAAGLSEEFLQPYVKSLRDVANTPEIATKFNNNAAEQTTEVGKYLAKIGLADTEIETAIKIYKTQGESALRSWMIDVHGASAEDVNTTVNLIDQQAIADLEAWRVQTGLSNEQVNTLIKLQFDGNPADMKAEMNRLGLTNGEIEAFVKIVGQGSTDQALAILNSKLQDVEKERTVRFKMDPSIYGEITELDRALSLLQDRSNQVAAAMKQAMMNKDNPATNQPSAPSSQPYVPYGQRILQDARERVNNAAGNVYEKHDAQIANKMRVWAEPETGGEAYIPLSPAKRARSLSIWQHTGKLLGVKGFASGGYDFPGRVYTAPDKPDKADAGPKGTDPWTIVVNMHEVGDMSDEEFKAALRDRMDSLEKYSSDWQQAWSQLNEFDKKAKEEQEKGWADAATAFNNAFEVGDVDPAWYRQWLTERLAETDKYSERYMEYWNKLKDFDADQAAKAKQAAEDAAEAEAKAAEARMAAIEKEERIWAYRNKKSEINDAEYLTLLRTRIAGEEKYSDRWFDLQDRIDDMEQKVLDAQEKVNEDKKKAVDERKRLTEAMYDTGALSRTAYLQALQSDLASAQKFSDEWVDTFNKINQLNGSAAIKDMGSVTNTPFSNQFISTNAVVSYFEKQATKVQKWSATLTKLGSLGVAASVMDQLLQSGPDSLPMAEALVRVYSDPASLSRFNAAQATISSYSGGFNNQFQAAPNQPASLPQGLTQAQFAALSKNPQSGYYGKTLTGPLVNIENYSASSPTDAQMIANQLSYQIRSLLP